MAARPAYVLVLHGGAGTIRREDLTEENELAVRQALDSALRAGEAILAEGGTAEEAVVRSISLLEDSPHFNAGRGAVFTYEGLNELDASLMRGSDLAAGAVAGVVGVRHPIQLAQMVMNASPHVMLSGAGALAFAREHGLEIVEPDFFRTDRRYEAWQRARERADAKPMLSEDGKFGTVGAVALDQHGHLAAGTSTGGMTLKRWGRIGDSPIIGAGTYADDRTCAVSATGHGEFFIRHAVAHDISARMAYGNKTLEEAAGEVINGVLRRVDGEGGVIAVDYRGNVSMPFNTSGMYRAFARPDSSYIGIYGDE